LIENGANQVSLIEVEALVPVPREEVFAFLTDFRNHCRLADRWIEVLRFDLPAESPNAPAHGGRIRMRGPLGVTRTATTRVVDAEPPARMAGTAEIGGRTLARVSWRLEPRGEATWVRLAAVVERAGALDRALLALGGSAWLRRRFRSVLARLAQALAPIRVTA
jgi:uncharacterized protein YndB with AHSA1/START domain